MFSTMRRTLFVFTVGLDLERLPVVMALNGIVAEVRWTEKTSPVTLFWCRRSGIYADNKCQVFTLQR